MEGPWLSMPTVPFRVVPVARIPKPWQPGNCHTIWNASLSGPYFAKSGLQNVNCIDLPVASNAASFMPPYMAMAWFSVQRICMTLRILACIAQADVENIEGRSRDFSHWFTIFCIAHTEHWKASIFLGDRSYIDLRAQMGRFTSAYLGQRTSFLITSIAMRHVTR